MFELSSLWTTILIIICGLLIILSVVFPSRLRIKKIYRITIRVVAVIFLIIWITLFADISIDSYFYVGSFLGVAFLLKGIIIHNKISSIFFSLSFISFTFVFLSIGQVFLFIITLSFSYLLFLALCSFYLFRSNDDYEQEVSMKLYQKILTGIIVIISVLIFGFVVYYISSQIIVFDSISLVTIFEVDPSLSAIFIIFLVLASIMVILFSFDVRSNSKSESEKTWYS